MAATAGNGVSSSMGICRRHRRAEAGLPGIAWIWARLSVRADGGIFPISGGKRILVVYYLNAVFL
jgi:hypothetical protein